MGVGETAQLAVELKINGVTAYTSGVNAATAANTKLAGSTAQVDKNLQGVAKTTSTFGQIKGGIIAGLGIGGGVAAFQSLERGISETIHVIGDFVDRGIEAEATTSRLTASLKANVPAWDGNIAAIEEYDNAGKKLGFTNDEMAESLSKLVAATHDVAAAQAILATAQDLARFKNISLSSATDALTKVEAGSYRILKSLGIQLKDNATQTDALAAVQAVAGGQAVAYANTTAGAQAKLNAAWDDAQETVGMKLLPAVTALANAMSDTVIPAFEHGTDAVGRFVENSQRELKGLSSTFGFDFNNQPLFGGRSIQEAIDYAAAIQKIGDSEDDERKQAIAAFTAIHAAREQAGIDVGHVVDDLNHASQSIAQNGGLGLQEWARQVTAGFPQMTALGKKTDEAFVSGLQSGQSDIDSTWADIIDTLKHPERRAKQIGHDIGILTSKALITALNSSNPQLAAEARLEVETITAELTSLDPTAKEAGKKSMQALRDAMHSKNPVISSAAAQIFALIEQNINQPSAANQWGLSLAQQVALGLSSGSSIAGIEAAARKLMAAALAGLGGGTPTNPKPGHPKPKPGSNPYNPRTPGPDGNQGGTRIGVTVNLSSSQVKSVTAHSDTFGKTYTGLTS